MPSGSHAPKAGAGSRSEAAATRAGPGARQPAPSPHEKQVAGRSVPPDRAIPQPPTRPPEAPPRRETMARSTPPKDVNVETRARRAGGEPRHEQTAALPPTDKASPGGPDAAKDLTKDQAPPDQPRGRGRTPKVYEAIGDGLTLTEPPRRYELLGEILTEAIATNPTDPTASAHWHAATLGRRIGAARSSDPLETVLVDLGYEPRAEGAAPGSRAGRAGPAAGSEVALGNCPFHALAHRQRELVCGINLAFLTGLLDGLGASGRRAELRPWPGGCCVRLSGARDQR